MKHIYEIDGNDFENLDGFYDAISDAMLPGEAWGRNLDALDDVLWGGFGTPVEGFILSWKNSEASKVRLGYPETIRVLKHRLLVCHPNNRAFVSQQIEDAKCDKGQTIFETLVEIFRDHGIGGNNPDHGVVLHLC